MSIRKADITVYLYVLAVLLSGMWMGDRFGTDWSPLILAIMGIVGAGWTAYYRYAIGPRIEAIASDSKAGQASTEETPRPENQQRERDMQE